MEFWNDFHRTDLRSVFSQKRKAALEAWPTTVLNGEQAPGHPRHDGIAMLYRRCLRFADTSRLKVKSGM